MTVSRMTLRSTRSWVIRLAKLSAIGLVILLITFIMLDQLILPLPREKLYKPSAAFIYSKEGYLLGAFSASDRFWRKPVRLDGVSPRLIKSVIAVEDRYFHYHPGVNPVSLVTAALDNLRAGKIVRGGSTLTMQIARMMERKERTMLNKLLEIFRSVQLEVRYSKPQLLELFLNLAPYGGNIEGVGAASYFYFDKEPSDLTWSEAALLTAIPASPENFRPDLNPERAFQKRQRILAILRDRSVITEQEYASALREKLPTERKQLPGTAPHFCQMVQSKYPDSTRLQTTLDFDIQTTCERLARIHQAQLKSKDIHNLAIVVIDNVDGSLLGLVGSPAFDDAAHSGQVNGAVAPRSPGSALKPFVYALSFERGLLSPQMRIEDIPVIYAGYEPENYDEQYHGVVSVRDALVHSYNVPAVNTAARLGLASIHAFLRQAGISTLEKEYFEYGLPLVLGAVEVRLLELANLYATLARGGIWKPVSELQSPLEQKGTRLFSEGAAYLVTDILVELDRPDLPTSWESTVDRTPVAWKTGTSYGRRDAWAIGYTPHLTVGVWVGNFSGKSSIDLVGAEAAAPLMFDIFNEITDRSPSEWFKPPPDVGTRKVCAVSGQPAGRFCAETQTELFLIGKSPSAKCVVHRPILVDSNTGLRLKPNCASGLAHQQVVVEMWPPRIASWLVKQGLARPLPAYHPGCLEIATADRPVIVSPENGSVFQLLGQLPEEYQMIAFQASIPGGDGTVHWFLDGEFFARTEASDRIFYAPQPGFHTLLCVDERGRSGQVKFAVELADY
jgi:penicillin-binding protein 1C